MQDRQGQIHSPEKISAVSDFLEKINHISLFLQAWHLNKFSRANSLEITFSNHSQNRNSNLWYIDFHKNENYIVWIKELFFLANADFNLRSKRGSRIKGGGGI